MQSVKSVISRLGLIICATLLVSACAEPSSANLQQAWQLQGSALEQPPTIEFNQKTEVFGSTGCNRFHGTYTVGKNGNELSFSPIAVTKMMCAPDQMEAEQAFLEALNQVQSFKIEADTLHFLGRNTTASPLMSFTVVTKKQLD